MAFKIALFAAVCFAQVFALPGDVLQENPTGELAHTFDETLNIFGDVSDTLAFPGNENEKIMVGCIMDQKEKSAQFAKRLSGLIRKIWSQWDKDLRDRSEKYIKRTDEPLAVIEETLTEFHDKLYVHLKDSKYERALDLSELTGIILDANSNIIINILREMVAVTDSRENVQFILEKLNHEVRLSRKIIREAFGRCMEQGGSK